MESDPGPELQIVEIEKKNDAQEKLKEAIVRTQILEEKINNLCEKKKKKTT